MGAASIDHPESNADTVTPLDAEKAVYTASDVDEADPDADLTWLLSGADASKFDLTGTEDMRTLVFKANPDYESPGDSGGNNVYEVTLVVTDSKGNSDEQDVTVKVTNMEEAGTVTLSGLQPRVGFPVTATLTDADNITPGSVSWQWYKGTVRQDLLGTLDDNECVAAATNDCFIKGAASDTYTPVAADVEDLLVAVALYTDGSPNEDDAKDFAMVATANQVLADTRNKAPVFPDQDPDMEGDQTDQELMVAENTESGMPIGVDDPVQAMDEDVNLTYTLGGPDVASFDIDRTSGQLQTKAELDKETKDTYTVTVTAEDSLNAVTTITVTITVTNVDELPDLKGDAPAEYPENGTGAVATFTAVDPEGESIVWSLAGDDMGEFTIVNGVLRFKSSPDFEDTGNPDHMYDITVQASDGRNTERYEGRDHCHHQRGGSRNGDLVHVAAPGGCGNHGHPGRSWTTSRPRALSPGSGTGAAA